MIDEKEFRERVKEIERRIPEAFNEDPCYYFLNGGECEFYYKNIKTEEPPNLQTKNVDNLIADFSDERLERLNKARVALGFKPLKR